MSAAAVAALGASAPRRAAPESSPPSARPGTPSGPVVKAAVEASGYTDTDAVRVITPTIAGTVADDVAGWSVTGRYLVDAVSAASVDIVASASGKWFEYRHVGSGAINFKAGDVGVSLSGGVSREPDYLSVGGGGSMSMELLDKNLTPSFGVSFGHDDVGRTGLPKSRWQTMAKLGIQPGVTFVVGRSTIAAVAWDAVFERGYLAKPYRYVPLFSPGAAETLGPGASVEDVNRLRLDARPIDQLPSERDRHAVTGRLARRFARSTLRFDERLYSDSWGLRASTTDLQYFVDVGERFLLWPHLRFHGQGAISFWQRTYEATVEPNGEVTGIPTYRTGDRELGSLYTVTAGLGWRVRLTDQMRVPWTLTWVLDAARTRFLNALYLTRRHALFTALTLEAGFQ